MMPTDKVTMRVASESLGRNESERMGSLEILGSEGRACTFGAKATLAVSNLANATVNLGGVLAMAR